MNPFQSILNLYSVIGNMDFSSFSTTPTSSNGMEKKEKKTSGRVKTAKAVKLSTDPQSVAARQRRHRIRDRFKILQSLIPGGAKLDTASMLEEAIHYVKFLKTQIWLHQTMINYENENYNYVSQSQSASFSSHQNEVCYVQNEYLGVEVEAMTQLALPNSWFQGGEISVDFHDI